MLTRVRWGEGGRAWEGRRSPGKRIEKEDGERER